jgi:putative sterol carrier protein
MEAKTPKEFFEKSLPEKFKPEKAVGVNIIAQIKISGFDGGEWIIKINNQKLQVTEGINSAASITLAMTQYDFMDIVNGKLSGEKAFFTGKIKFKGNIATALKLKEAGFL